MQLNGRSQEPWLFLCVVSLSVSAVTWGEVSYSSWDFTCLNLPRRNDSELSWDLKQMSSVACLICRSSCTVKVTPTCSYLALWLTYTAFAQQHRQSRHHQIKICGRFKSHCDFGTFKHIYVYHGHRKLLFLFRLQVKHLNQLSELCINMYTSNNYSPWRVS